MRFCLSLILLIGIAFSVRAMSQDSLFSGSSSSSSSIHDSNSGRANWHRTESELDRGNRRVIDDSTWLLDEIHFSHALQNGHLREFDLLQIERDRMERMEERDRMLSGQNRITPPRPNPLTSGYLRMVRDPLSFVIRSAEK